MSPVPGSYLLQITWRGDQLDEAFSIKCRTPDQLTQWHKTVSKAVEEMAAQRRSRSAGQLRRLASPHSQFPNTPQSELGPMIPGFGGSSASLHSAMGYPSNPYGGTFEDEAEDVYPGEYESTTGRSTPSLGGGMQRRGVATQSLPPGVRQNGDTGGQNGSRPRAQTEDSNSAVINQWRSQTPSGGYPSVPALPRQASMSSSATSNSPQEGPPPSLRHSASKSALRKKQSHEWSNPVPHPPSSSTSSTATYTPALNGLRGQSIAQQMDELSLQGNEPLRMLRQNSQGNMPIHNAPPPLRSRSASSPHVYQLTPGQLAANGQTDKQWSPYPIENVHPAHFGSAQMGRQMSNGHAMPLKRNMAGNSSTATIASTAGSATTAPVKRFSSCSTGTDRSSEDSGQSQSFNYVSPTSSISATPGMNGYSRESQSTPQPHLPSAPTSPSSAIKIKVNYGEDTFVIVVLSSISYMELSRKVLHKIQLCGARTNGLTAASLRLKYEDEEGDKILMTADDDVAMAFDWLRSGQSPHASLLVYAE